MSEEPIASMEVLRPRRNRDTGTNSPDGSAPSLHLPAACRRDQGLTEPVAVPCRPYSRIKGNIASARPPRLRVLK